MYPGVVDTKINENDIPFLSLYVGTDARNAHRRVSSLPGALHRRKHPIVRETACECVVGSVMDVMDVMWLVLMWLV